VEPFVSSIVDNARPAYLRLGAGKKTPENSTTSGSFKLVNYSPTATTTLITLGPVVNNALAAVADLGADVNILSVFNLPLQLSSAVVEILEKAPDILVVEEHVSIGGLGQQLGVQLLERGVKTRSFTSLRAQGYPNGRYGSQNYHQKISGIDPQSLIQHIANLSKTL
jgi:transketolase